MIDIKPYGNSALLVCFDNEISIAIHHQVKALFLELKQHPHVLSLIPAYNSITVVYNKESVHFLKLKSDIESFYSHLAPLLSEEKKIVKIPVCYEDEYAPDMDEVCKKTALSRSEIIALHTATDYLVYMLGFTPGFPYLGGLDHRLHVPRKSTPRLAIPAGSVGLAGEQTGIYPQDTPGGWQIIGRSPFRLFQPESPFPVEMGDYIQFYSIDTSTFHQLLEK